MKNCRISIAIEIINPKIKNVILSDDNSAKNPEANPNVIIRKFMNHNDKAVTKPLMNNFMPM